MVLLLQAPADGPAGESSVPAPLRPPSAKGGRKRQTSNEGPNQAEGEVEGGAQQKAPPHERVARQVEEDGVKEEPGAQVGVTQEDEEDHPSTPPLPPMAIALAPNTHNKVHCQYAYSLYIYHYMCLYIACILHDSGMRTF